MWIYFFFTEACFSSSFFLAISLKRSLCNVIGMLSFRKYYMILMGRGDLYFFFQFDKIMHYFLSILEHCTQLNYTLHSKYHTYIGENFKKIRIEKSIIQNCNWQMMFGLEEEFFSLCIKKLSIDLMTYVWVWKKWSFFHSNIEKLVINHVFWR